MLHYIYGKDLNKFSTLAETMFKDRAEQFSKRLGWAVDVDENGHERDEYDDLNPLYVIWECEDGTHGGSMRFLPTTERTMVNDHFLYVTHGVKIESPFIWESTRFCLAPGAGGQVSACLSVGGAELMKAFHLDHLVGVFDPRMERIYRSLGMKPTVIGKKGKGREQIGVGLWERDEFRFSRLLKRAGITHEQSKFWLDLSLGLDVSPGGFVPWSPMLDQTA